MKYKLIIGAVLAALLGMGSVSPTYAEEAVTPTFEEQASDNEAKLRFGSNILLAGNNIESAVETPGLFLTAGNQLNLKTKSEYNFVAGNVINYSGETSKDLFVAGNAITVYKNAKIGRDLFVAGNSVTLESNVESGSVSVAAATVALNGVNIAGDLNLDVEKVVVNGQTNVTGKVIINDDAEVINLDKLSYKELEKYENVEVDITVSEILLAKIFSIAALFITFIIIMAMFPGVDKRVAKELSGIQFLKDIVIGMVVLVCVPIIALFLLLTMVGAPAALILLAAYVIMIYLAQGYVGLWLGKLLIEKAMHGKINKFLELLLGLLIIGFASLIPVAGASITLLVIVLGLGLFMQSIKPNRQKKTPAAEIREAEVVVKEKPSTKKADEVKEIKSEKTTKTAEPIEMDDTKTDDAETGDDSTEDEE